MNMQHFGHGERAGWTFTYTAGQLAYGAQKQKDYREDRSRLWSATQEKVMAEIRASGIEITQDVMTQLQISATYTKSGGMNRGPTVSINQDLADKFAQCVAKVKEHKDLAEQYEGWIQTLSAQSEKELEVTQQDFLFFFFNVKDIPGVVSKTVLTPAVATQTLASMPQVQITSTKPAKAQLIPPINPLSPMTAPPLKPKAGEVPMATVPSLGPAAANVFVPPDFDDDLGGNPGNDWPQD
jgi:hypothetical protein